MSEIQMWLFLVVAAVMAIIIGRLGTVLKDRIQYSHKGNKKANKLG